MSSLYKLWRILSIVLCIAALGFFTSCKDFSSDAGSCDHNNWGRSFFENKSSTNSDYYIYLDDEYLLTVKAGTTEPQGEGAIINKGDHTLVFKFTSDQTIACGPQTVTIEKCKNHKFTCSN